MSRFRGVAEGVEVTLNGPELALLTGLTSLLGAAGVEKDDPARERLHPRIYPDDDTASREFDRLIGKERIEARSSDREMFAGRLDESVGGDLILTPEEAGAWARVLGEARIVLAARKGLFESGMPDDPSGDPEVAFIMFLGYVQEDLVSAMLSRMENST